MKIIKNEKLIKRNGQIGQWTSIGALVILAAGMYISFQRPDLFNYAIIALLVGFIMTQVSMYFGNRWGRSPRPDESLDAGLKGLPGDFTIYHFATPASHLLVGPAGIWVVMPYHQRGKVAYKNNRWRMSGGGFLQGYMRLFGQEGLGRPDLEAGSEIAAIKKELVKHMGADQVPPISAVLVFTNEDTEVDAADAPIPAMKLKQLKDFFRQKTKTPVLGSLALQNIKSLLAGEE